MPTFAGRPSTVSSLTPVEIPQNPMVGQQRQQISELQFDKFPTPSSFLYWKIRFKNQATTCSDFHRKQCYGSKKWRWSIQWVNKNHHDQLLERMFQILRCWTRRLPLTAMRPKKAWNLCKKHIQARRERQDYIPFALRRVGIVVYINEGAG